MNSFLSKYFVYYPVTMLKGEFVSCYLEQYRKRQFDDPKSLEQYQRAQLRKLLLHTASYSSYYKNYAKESLKALDQGKTIIESLKSFPYLTKQQLIENKETIATYKRHWSSTKTTGGSTGEPVKLYKNPGALARERAATWRAYEWAGVSIGDMQARFWGIPHGSKDKKKAKLIDFLSNRVRVSAFNLSDDSFRRYYELLSVKGPKYLYGYVSVIEAFAVYIIENKLSLPSLVSVITTSEVLTPLARDRISKSFGVNVFNEYGCGEVGSVAHECGHGSMHIMADNLIVELDGEGDSGEVVVTDLFNYANPLIRYRLGDFATIDYEPCGCGVKLPSLKGIHGRAYDMITLSDGRQLHPESVMYIFESIQQQGPIFKQFQVIQETQSHFVINVVPQGEWSEQIAGEITAELRVNLSSDITTKFHLLESIPREKSGKMRVIKSNVN